MKCSGWEVEIAGEAESEALQRHLLQCARCRQFAQEVSANREALEAFAFDPASLMVVRNRVMDALHAPRRARVGWIWPAAVAACLAILCGSLAMLRFAIPARPKPVVALARPPIFPQVAEAPPPHPIHQRRALTAAHANREPLVIKMLTDDPDVVIIWIADQKGNAL
jgi:hypothetical protein